VGVDDVHPPLAIERHTVRRADLGSKHHIVGRHRLAEVLLEDVLQPEEQRALVLTAARLDVAEGLLLRTMSRPMSAKDCSGAITPRLWR
jgi:hypothetical protein